MEPCYQCGESNNCELSWCGRCFCLLRLTDRYEVRKILGEGRFGRVYLARNRYLGSEAAIKHIKVGTTQGRFNREVALGKKARRLKAKHLVHVLEDVDTGTEKFIIQNYIPGETLQDVLNRGMLSLAEKFSIAMHLARALGELAELNFVHRDLKPRNIQIGQPHGATILDFGTARDDVCETLTSVRDIIGTPLYIAPELCYGTLAKPKPSADIFSYGIILYQLFHNDVPYDTNIEEARISQGYFAELLQRKLEIRSGSWPHVPEQISKLLDQIFHQCTQAEPEDRCSAADLYEWSKMCWWRHRCEIGEIERMNLLESKIAPHLNSLTFLRQQELKSAEYQGEWRDDLPHGYGRCLFYYGDNQAEYQGPWCNGLPHGNNGILEYSGIRYIGEFTNGEFYGQGTLEYAQKIVYRGSFKNGKKHGEGTEILDDGTFQGHFCNGLRHGYGKRTKADGSQYIGDYRNNVRHGRGIEISAENTTLDVQYENGECVWQKLQEIGA